LVACLASSARVLDAYAIAMLLGKQKKCKSMNQHTKQIITAGKKIAEAKKAIIMLHGRGADAESILSLSNYLNLKDFALLAPQATNNTWYPYSFMAPVQQNQPWLNAALILVKQIIDEVTTAGVNLENIFLLGFSQGACLTLEYAARNAARYGGIVAFTGGLIGDRIYNENYKGCFNNTPLFIGSSDVDMHVPVQRVYATINILKDMGAVVTEKIYPGMGHTINEDEINRVNENILKA
jgi:phospholipase/carboxylesterase